MGFRTVFISLLCSLCLLIVFGSQSLAITVAGTNTGAVADGTGNNVCGPARAVNFAVSGLTTPVVVSSVSLTMTHTWVGDLQVTLIAPNATQFVIFSNVGKQALGADAGDDSNLGGGAYVFQDSATLNFWTAASLLGDNATIPVGSYRTQAAGPFANDSPGPAFTLLSSAFAGVPNPNGTWVLRFQDCFGADIGTVSAASLTITGTTAASASVSGRVVTSNGRGIANARITVADPNQGEPIIVITNPFGYFNVAGIPAGQAYLLTVSSKSYSFAQPTRVIAVNDDIAGLEFVADQ